MILGSSSIRYWILGTWYSVLCTPYLRLSTYGHKPNACSRQFNLADDPRWTLRFVPMVSRQTH